MRASLLLNASYEPLATISAERAVRKILNGDAITVEDSPATFRSQHVTIHVPYVLRNNKYVKWNAHMRSPMFSKHGVLVRDGHSCAYCGKYANTIDHIIPRKDGGASTYENCVAACRACNNKKGHKSLKQMNWEVAHTLDVPSHLSKMLSRAAKTPEVFESWSKYIFMFEPGLEEKFAKLQRFPEGNLATTF